MSDRDVNALCVKKNSKVFSLFTCGALASFASNLTILFQHSFSVCIYTQSLKFSLNQLYHLADSLISKLNKFLTHALSIFYQISVLKFVKVILRHRQTCDLKKKKKCLILKSIFILLPPHLRKLKIRCADESFHCDG